MTELTGMTRAEITAFFQDQGYPAFRGKQVYEWIHKKNVDSYDEMTNISAKLKGELEKKYYVNKC